MKGLLEKLDRSGPLPNGAIIDLFELLLDNKTLETDIKVLIETMSRRPVCPEDLVEAAQVLRAHAVKVSLGPLDAIDTAGTGGDRSGSFNFSTASALLAAASGVPVAKHGNRSITSRSGSADLLEALGVPIDLGPEAVVRSIRETRFGFMLAPNYHPATARVQKIRREIGKTTLFNFLGPLVNPAGVKRQVVGVFDNAYRPVMAEALYRLGTKKAWVVWGEGGLDELSLAGVTWISEVGPGGIREISVTPEDAVLRRCDAKFLKGGDGVHNAKILEGIFSKSFFGPLVNGVLLNTAAALIVADEVSDLKEGVAKARLTIENGDALTLLEKLRATASLLHGEESRAGMDHGHSEK